MLDEFTGFPDETPIWIYVFDSRLDQEEERKVRSKLDGFIAEWNSHGQPVDGRYVILEDQIAIIAGNCSGGISGCSIDSKVRVFKELHDNFGLNALGGTRIVYRNTQGQIETADRVNFRQKVLEGEIKQRTPVFDLTARSLGDLRDQQIEHPFAKSWAFSVFVNSPADITPERTI